MIFTEIDTGSLKVTKGEIFIVKNQGANRRVGRIIGFELAEVLGVERRPVSKHWIKKQVAAQVKL